MSRFMPDRRRLLLGAAGFASASTLAGCDRIARTAFGQRALGLGEDANLFVQRLLLTPQQLAPEYTDADLSPMFKANGTEDPPDRDYKALVRRKFADYRLEVGGLVEKPYKISLPELRKLESRTQITRHDCVEGWTCIGKWTGVPVRLLLDRAGGLKANARFVVFHCADTMDSGGSGLEGGDDDDDDDNSASDAKAGSKGNGQTKSGDAQSGEKEKSALSNDGGDDAPSKSSGVKFYGSIDLTDAYHPQTILAYEMNGAPLPVAHGAPLRLRLERSLGYKMSKYVMRIEVVESFAQIGKGRGGYWEDTGYAWYAGI